MKLKKILVIATSLLFMSSCTQNQPYISISPSSNNSSSSSSSNNNESTSGTSSNSENSTSSSTNSSNNSSSLENSSSFIDSSSENNSSSSSSEESTSSSSINNSSSSSSSSSSFLDSSFSSESASSSNSSSESSLSSSSSISSDISSSSEIDSSSNSSSSFSSIDEKEVTSQITFDKGNGKDGSDFEINNSNCVGSFIAKSSEKLYQTNLANKSIKMGSGSGLGSIILASNKLNKVKSILIHASKYNSDTDVKLIITLSNNEKVTCTIDEEKDYIFSFSGNELINEIKIENNGKKKRLYISKIIISSNEIDYPSKDDQDSSSSSSSSSSNSSSNNSSSSSSSSEDFKEDDDYYKGNYYNSISSSSKGNNFIKELQILTSSTHKPKSYNSLWDAYKIGDIRPNTNYIWDIYSNENYVPGSKQCGSYKGEGDCYNREHSVPKSWFKEASPMVSDYIHILPTDGYVNGRRSNYAYGEVENPIYVSKNGSKLGSSSISGIKGRVFEPIDEYKGDVARIYFYMASRYSDRTSSWTNGDSVFTGTFPYIKLDYFKLYLKWAIEDPVSEKEIIRNNASQSFQGNRNPFVDHPSYLFRAYSEFIDK